ncbi:MAG TPA: FecR domain-containing protein [Dinghuibacter sp.]|uniref:FecR family protein n=1 Tax=Dinghuibacter sp. TaxID=2024697 RepID=UPI002C2F4E86|nr:FecR domain-containing protein [Dinghuibacter sp.]HTJ14614.1 FecR domain-containing protein [Dinghuibacter sp.]
MENQRILDLVQQYLSGGLDAGDKESLFAWLRAEENRETFVDTLYPLLMASLASQEPQTYQHEEWDEVLHQVLRSDRAAPVIPLRRRRWQWVAAAAVLLSGAVCWKFFYPTKPPTPVITQAHAIIPGGKRAVLTLSDGRRVTLDSASNGLVAQQGDAKVVKVDSGALAYTAAAKPGEAMYNTLATPKGGEYHLTLPDGSQVWLNAASSITYPTAFTGNDRTVTMTGEAYFQVAADAAKPFRVRVEGRQEVDVLGTQFDIKSYEDEPVLKTTLLQGSVDVLAGRQKTHPLAGQQTVLQTDGRLRLVTEPDLESAVAWKSGLFVFKNEDIPSIMRQISRWYDITVHIEGAAGDKTYTGQMPRSAPITDVLAWMEASGIHFRIKGNDITVQP